MSTTSTLAADADTGASEAFADRMMASALGWIDLMAVHLGSQLGWYRALADADADGLTADGLAAATSSSARYAREWLEQQATSGTLTVDLDTAPHVFRLAPGVREVLIDRGSLLFLEPLARMLAASGAQLPAIIDAYRSGGGVSWDALGVHARESQADMNRPWFDDMPSVIGGVPHVDEVLRRPHARIADIGTGFGWSAIALAQAYPQLRVEGFDIDAPSVEAARRNAVEAGVADRVTFHLADAAQLADHAPFDAAFAFECLHDMPHPTAVLEAARRAVADDGVVVIMDEAAADEFAPETSDLEKLLYGFSLFVCLPDGMSTAGSAGTGTVMRPDTLRGYARAAGWNDVRVLVPEFGLWRFYEMV